MRLRSFRRCGVCGAPGHTDQRCAVFDLNESQERQLKRRRDNISLGLTPELEAQIARIRAAWSVGLATALLVLFCATSVVAGTISGQVQTPTGGVLKNGTLGFKLSQPAVLSGTAIISTAQSYCYTSSVGNIVGLPDPLVLPIVSTNTSSGALTSGTYYTVITYYGAGGETVASPETSTVLSATGTLIITAPVLQPPSATGYKVYIGATSGSETLQATVVGFTQYQQTSALAAGTALPASNTTVCSVAFSDTLIPTGTYYSVSLVNKNGSMIAGFPQTWCTFGGAAGTINVSNGAPTGNCGSNGVFYPTPIFANPQNNAPQSISGPLALPGGIIGPLSLSGVISFTGAQIACTINGVQYVGADPVYTNCWGASDIGAQINAAYAALPANGGTIVVTPKSDNSCHTFTTPIVATTSGKYLLLESLQSGGVSTGCLNFTPSTGSAMTFDYVPVGGARGGLYGVRDLWLNNNQCISIGGCATTNTGISVLNTNGGIDGAMMENVTIQGFTAGYTENARVPTAAVQWINPHIFNNTAGMILYNSAEEEIVGGTFYGNGVHIQAADTASHPEMHITGTFFVAHGIEAFDFTRTSLEGALYISDVHLENGASVSANAHYIEGNLEVFGKGGVAEDDSASGTADWWFKPSSDVFIWDGLEVVTGSRNPTIGILNLAVNTRAKLTGFVVNPVTLTAIVGGANAGKATVCMLSGDISNVASACKIESPLQDVNGLSYSRTISSGTATMTTAAIAGGACGTTVTVSATGALTTDAITDSFNAAIGANPGVLTVQHWPTANNVNFEYCNPTAGSVTPTAATLNWRVIR